MNDSEREQIVRNYIEQALKVQNEQDDIDELPDLEAVARELGMTDLDMAEVGKAAHEHFERGSHYCKHRQWDDAIRELRVATALDPHNVPATHLLAESYAGRWRENRSSQDRAEAERLAKRCIDQQADYEPAFALLESLKEKPHTAPPAAAAPVPGANVARVGIAVAAVMIMAGIGVAAFFFSRTPSSVSTVVQSSSSSSSSSVNTGRPIPFQLKTTAEFNGMTTQLDRSRIITSENIYCLQGDITPAGGSDTIASIPLRLDMIDSTGKVMATDQFTAWPCSKHPGSYNFHRDNPLVPGLRQGVLYVNPTGTNQ